MRAPSGMAGGGTDGGGTDGGGTGGMAGGAVEGGIAIASPNELQANAKAKELICELSEASLARVNVDA